MKVWGQCTIVRPARGDVEREADAVRDHWLRTDNAHGEGGGVNGRLDDSVCLGQEPDDSVN